MTGIIPLIVVGLLLLLGLGVRVLLLEVRRLRRMSECRPEEEAEEVSVELGCESVKLKASQHVRSGRQITYAASLWRDAQQRFKAFFNPVPPRREALQRPGSPRDPHRLLGHHSDACNVHNCLTTPPTEVPMWDAAAPKKLGSMTQPSSVADSTQGRSPSSSECILSRDCCHSSPLEVIVGEFDRLDPFSGPSCDRVSCYPKVSAPECWNSLDGDGSLRSLSAHSPPGRAQRELQQRRAQRSEASASRGNQLNRLTSSRRTTHLEQQNADPLTEEFKTAVYELMRGHRVATGQLTNWVSRRRPYVRNRQPSVSKEDDSEPIVPPSSLQMPSAPAMPPPDLPTRPLSAHLGQRVVHATLAETTPPYLGPSSSAPSLPVRRPPKVSSLTKEEPKLISRDPAVQAGALIGPMLRQLEQTRGEPLEVRKGSFRAMQRKLHPDKNIDCVEAAKMAFQELMEHRAAYLASSVLM